MVSTSLCIGIDHPRLSRVGHVAFTERYRGRVSVETGPVHPSTTPRDPEAGRRSALPEDVVRRAPKVLLHDHLDGGLRPATIIELAAETG
jgi:hypothetical protein